MKMQVDETVSWQNSKLMKLQVDENEIDEITSWWKWNWWNYKLMKMKLMKLQVDEIISW